MEEIRVLTADGQRLFAEALGLALNERLGISVVGPSPSNGLDAVAATTQEKPDVVLLDYWLAGMEGPATTAAILARVPNCKVIIVSWFCGPPQIQNTFSAGASGFLMKTATLDQIHVAIERAHAGEAGIEIDSVRPIPAGPVGQVGPGERRGSGAWRSLARLAPREIRLLEELSLSGHIEDAAAELSVTLATARTYMASIRSKTGVRSQDEVLEIARRHGFLTPRRSERVAFPTTMGPSVRPMPDVPRTGVSVLVADGQYLFADAVSFALSLWPDLTVLDARPTSAAEVIDVVSPGAPDVAIIDYWFVDKAGPETTRAILAKNPNCKVILMSGNHSAEHIKAGLSAGAVGFLPKGLPFEKLGEGVRHAYVGERPIFPQGLADLIDEIENRVLQRNRVKERFDMLTSTEVKILKLLCEGDSLVAIAEKLGITRGTAKLHLHNILTKTRARSRAEVVSLAHFCGLVYISA